jgi:hypothetical protein
MMYFFLIATTLVFIASIVKGDPSSSSSSGEDISTSQDTIATNWYTIEGKVIRPDRLQQVGSQKQQQRSSGHESGSDWASQVQILVNGGENVGYLQEDGTFKIHGLSSGSHVIDVIHPNVHYESARVDITSKGKIRARKVNHLQPSLVTHMVYPLRLTPIGQYRYFQIREQWRVTDVLFSPMVLMMVLPLILIVILPKMMSDPETRKEMESVTMPKYEMPEMSEMLTSFFGGGSSSSNNENGGSERKKAIRVKKAN